jgi:type VI secretion system protein ImpK
MFNQALMCCIPILNQLSPFLGSEKGVSVSFDFREGLVADFFSFEREAFSRGLDAKKIEHIKYALAALADECVMNSLWPGKLSWMRRSLQLQFFGEHTAGEGFFERLSQLRQSGLAELDVLEIYAVCLQLGFQGVYKFKDKTQYSALITGLENQLEVTRGKQDFCLESRSLTNAESIHKSSREISLGWVGLVTATLIFFIYVGYSIATRIQLHHAIQALSAEVSYDS